MLPYSIQSKKSVDSLYQLKATGKYQLIHSGEIGPVMVGRDYVIFENDLANELNEFEIEGVRFEAAIIWNRKNNIEHSQYQRAIISNHFSSDQINEVNLLGLRFLVMSNEYLFVSPDLKEIIESQYSSYFTISEGLSNFG